MRKEFTKQDLKSGDIVVLRNGDTGVVMLGSDIILYPTSGFDDLDFFSDDLRNELDDDKDFDIMKVYRGSGKPGEKPQLGFTDYEDADPVYEREDEDETDINSESEEIPAGKGTAAGKENPFSGDNRSAGDDGCKEKDGQNTDEEPVQKKKSIGVIVQAIYGNRTFMSIKLDEIDAIIDGCLGKPLRPISSEGRAILRIPGSENLVLVYNKYREEEDIKKAERLRKEKGWLLKPLADIPELDLVLYSRCIACRMNEDGELESLEPEDGKIIMKYLAS